MPSPLGLPPGQLLKSHLHPARYLAALDQLPYLGICEEITDLELVAPLDNECFVKVRIAHLDVLHAQELAQTR